MQHLVSILYPVTRPSPYPLQKRLHWSDWQPPWVPASKAGTCSLSLLFLSFLYWFIFPITAYLPFQTSPFCFLEHQLCLQTPLLPVTFCLCFKWNLRKLLCAQPSGGKRTNFPSALFSQSGASISMYSPRPSLLLPGCDHFAIGCCHLLTFRSFSPIAEDSGPGLITVLSLDWF